jgi:hypothetical protein
MGAYTLVQRGDHFRGETYQYHVHFRSSGENKAARGRRLAYPQRAAPGRILGKKRAAERNLDSSWWLKKGGNWRVAGSKVSALWACAQYLPIRFVNTKASPVFAIGTYE